MDFATICKKIEVDKIRDKFGLIPSFPSLKNVRIPNSFSNWKSLKIFQSHDAKEESVKNRKKTSKKEKQLLSSLPSDFINYAPSRISTISSLTHKNDNKYDNATVSYRSADAIDDDYAMCTERSNRDTIVSTDSIHHHSSTPAIIRTPTEDSFTEKLHRRYIDFSDFKLKHILSKKTVVRKDNIEVDQYVKNFKREIAIEQEEIKKRDIEIGDDYCINISLSPQKLSDSDCTSNTIETKSLNEDNCQENFDHFSCLKHKPGSALRRFSKGLNRVQLMSLQYEENTVQNCIEEQLQSHDTIKAVVQKPPNHSNEKISSTKLQKFKTKLKRLHSRENIFSDLYNTRNVDITSTMNHKIRIWKKSLTKNDVNKFENNINIVNKKLNEEKGVPSHITVLCLLKKWKKHTINQGTRENVDGSMQTQKRSETLIRKLKYIRSRKNSNSVEDITLEKGTNAIQQLTIVQNEDIINSVQQSPRKPDISLSPLKIERHTPERHSKEDEYGCMDEYTARKCSESLFSTLNLSPSKIESYKPDTDDNMDDEYDCLNVYTADNCTNSNKKAISKESIVTDDKNFEYPQVHFHQDNSNFFESTLIITVTEAASASPTPKLGKKSIKHAEDSKIQNLKWASNKNTIAESKSSELTNRMINFENIETYPGDNIPPLANLKKHTYSTGDIDGQTNGDAKKRQIFKSRSIDILDVNNLSTSKAFDNFDEELCNEPILKISPIRFLSRDNEKNNEEQLKRNYLPNEHMTVINEISKAKMKKCYQFRDSKEHFITRANESLDDDVEFNWPSPKTPSSPLLLISPLLQPSSEQRINNNSSIRNGSEFIEEKKGSLSLSRISTELVQWKPIQCNSLHNELSKTTELLSTKFEKSYSKPLVRTSSLSSAFQQVEVTDIGKVNKLISHFEQPVKRALSLNKTNYDNSNTSSILFSSKTPPEKIKNNINKQSERYLNVEMNNVTKNNIFRGEEKKNKCYNSYTCHANSNLTYPDSEYNCSSANSSQVYYSPKVTPTNVKPFRLAVSDTNNNKKQRAIIKESDNYYSFDSDEENSYYSLSSSNSSRYVVEI